MKRFGIVVIALGLGLALGCERPRQPVQQPPAKQPPAQTTPPGRTEPGTTQPPETTPPNGMETGKTGNQGTGKSNP